MGLILAMVFPIVFGSRQALQSDQLRTAANQGLRTTADIIGSDIRTAGERFPQSSALQLLPIEITPASGDESAEIRLRRNLWDLTLPLCQQRVQGGNNRVRVARPQGQNNNQGPGNGWNDYPQCFQTYTGGVPDNLLRFQELLDEIGEDGQVGAYFHDPTPGETQGEFFT
ncbi:MAG: hypothetical protein EA352_08240, partial [Gemmatimonadales bacterium]